MTVGPCYFEIVNINWQAIYCNEFQAIQQKTQKMERDYQNEKRLLEKDLQATRQNILDVMEAQEQVQQSIFETN